MTESISASDAPTPNGKIIATVAATLCVLYALSLTAIALDEILDLGWFPSELEKQVAAQIELLASSDPAVQESARAELSTGPGFVVVPSLIDELESENQKVRKMASDLLKERTQEYLNGDLMGYSADSSPAQRSEALRKLREWWDVAEDDF